MPWSANYAHSNKKFDRLAPDKELANKETNKKIINQLGFQNLSII